MLPIEPGTPAYKVNSPATEQREGMEEVMLAESCTRNFRYGEMIFLMLGDAFRIEW